MSKSPITRSLMVFLLILILATGALGLIGIFAAQIISYLILLPYFVAFWIMIHTFLKQQQAMPTQRQRWLLSGGALAVFWLYSVVAGLVGLQITHQWENLAQFDSRILAVGLLLLGIVSASLLLLGYWFSGKPTGVIWKNINSSKK